MASAPPCRFGKTGRVPNSLRAAECDGERCRDVIRVAVHDAPMEGKQVADFLFGVLSEELGDVAVTDEIIEGDKAVVVFETSIQGQEAQGLNVLHFDDSGTIRDLTVFFRPLASLSLIAEVIGARMAAQFGPAPE